MVETTEVAESPSSGPSIVFESKSLWPLSQPNELGATECYHYQHSCQQNGLTTDVRK
jgi:hypothetical protein